MQGPVLAPLNGHNPIQKHPTQTFYHPLFAYFDRDNSSPISQVKSAKQKEAILTSLYDIVHIDD